MMSANSTSHIHQLIHSFLHLLGTMQPLLHPIAPTAKVQMDHWRSMPTVVHSGCQPEALAGSLEISALLSGPLSRRIAMPGPRIHMHAQLQCLGSATCSSSGGSSTPSRSRPSLNHVLPNGIL